MKELVGRKDEASLIPKGAPNVNSAPSPAVETQDPYAKMLNAAGPQRAAHTPGWGEEAQTGNGTVYPRDGNPPSKGSPASAYPKDGNFVSKGSDPGKFKKG